MVELGPSIKDAQGRSNAKLGLSTSGGDSLTKGSAFRGLDLTMLAQCSITR
jgi:hypothetical protein